jgi:glycosyltransferase involved in cell wall biosynthesis
VAITLPGLIADLQQRGVESSISACAEHANGTKSSDLASIRQLVGAASVVHVHGWNNGTLRAVASLTGDSGKPFVVSPLGGATLGRIRRRTWTCRLKKMLGGDRVLRRSTCVTGINEFERAQLVEERVHRNIRLLPYGFSIGTSASPRVVAEPSNPDQDLMLLYLGPIDPREGLVALLKAASEIGLDRCGWRLVLAGPTVNDWMEMIRSAVNRKGASERVEFVENPDPRQQNELLVRATAVVSPSLHPRCPVAVMQALAMGIPVIGTSACAVSGVNGAMQTCTPSREGIRSALRQLVESQSSHGMQARPGIQKTVASEIDWSERGGAFLKLYSEIA